MKAIDLSSPLDRALEKDEITPTEWIIKKRKEIEEDIKKQFGSQKRNKKKGGIKNVR